MGRRPVRGSPRVLHGPNTSDTGPDTGKVRKTENLMTARIGDSVVVRYLPDDPDVHRLVRSEDSKYRVIRPRPRSRARRSAS